MKLKIAVKGYCTPFFRVFFFFFGFFFFFKKKRAISYTCSLSEQFNLNNNTKIKMDSEGNESIGSTRSEQTLPVKNHTPIKKRKRGGKEPSWVFKEGHFVKPEDPKKSKN